MKKKSSPTQLAYWASVSLYRDELEEIIEILTKSGNEVVIEDNYAIYESLDELLDKKGPNPKQLSITSQSPYVTFQVRIKPRWTSVATTGDGANLVPYHFVRQILESNKRGGLGFILGGSPSILFWLLGLGVFLILPGVRPAVPAWGRWLYVSVLMFTSINSQSVTFFKQKVGYDN